jgi:hypothetical protein
MNDSISFVSRAYRRQSSLYRTMIVSFLRNRHGSDFDCLNPSISYIALSLRNQFHDACTSPYKLRLSFNAHFSFSCSKPAGNQRLMSSFSFACGKACVKLICFPFRLCIAVSVFTMSIVISWTTGTNDYVQSMPCICLLPFTHSRALYFFKDPSGRHFHLYVQMRAKYLVLAGSLVLGMNSNVFMSINPSTSGLCALINLLASTCLFICACVSTSRFCICMA